VGVAEEHRAFDGTLWVSADAFRAYVRETATSLASHGVDRIVLVNGHGGNVAALDEVAARLSRDGVARTAAFTWFEAVDAPERMGHAGALETALVRALRPELVREAAAEGAADRWGRWVAGVNLAHDTDEFTGNGVVGDPRDGDPAVGEELLEEAADALVEVLAGLGRSPPDGRS